MWWCGDFFKVFKEASGDFFNFSPGNTDSSQRDSSKTMELPLARPADCTIRSVILFLAAKNKSPAEIHRELCEVFGVDIMSVQMVRRWVKELKEGRRELHDLPRAGRPPETKTRLPLFALP